MHLGFQEQLQGGEKLFALGVHEGFCLSCALIRLLGSKTEASRGQTELYEFPLPDKLQVRPFTFFHVCDI